MHGGGCRQTGVTRLFRVGGAHAIAALAYGTSHHSPRGSRSCGSRQPLRGGRQGVNGRSDCAIDFYACGPDGDRHRWPAPADRRVDRRADLVAQAEHDPDARPIHGYLEPIARRYAVARAAGQARRPRATAERRDLADRERRRDSRRRSVDEAIALSNRIAPEHLVGEIASRSRAARFTAGALFVGPFAAQACRRLRATTLEPRAADFRGSRAFRGGLSAAGLSCA